MPESPSTVQHAVQRPPAKRLLHVLVLTAIVLAMLPALNLKTAGSAEAAYANGGDGLYKGNIDWMTWGTHDALITPDTRSVSTRQIGDQKQLVTTCIPSDITNIVRAHKSGSYKWDSMDNLYNVGGMGPNNQLVYGLGNMDQAQLASFTVSCNAVIKEPGLETPVRISGLVMADAESSGLYEYITAQPQQPDTNWRLIERYRSPTCQNNIKASLESNQTLRLEPIEKECPTADGMTAIAFMEGAHSAKFTVKGAGKTAVALGVVIDSDFGDAPSSYGSAGALFHRGWSGSYIPVGDSYVFTEKTPSIGLSTLTQPLTRLGALVDSESMHQASAGSDADDALPSDDEDAIGALGTIAVYPGQTYSLPNVACTGPGHLAGWIDWNNNRIFDAGERSNQAECTGTTVGLSWTVPADVSTTAAGVQSALRLRIAADAPQIATATGISTTGEVEDHALRVNVPTVRVHKNVAGRVSANDQFTLSLSTAGQPTDAATTAGTSTGLQSAQVGPKTAVPGTSFTFAEAMAPGSLSPLSEYDSKYSCTATYPDGSSTIVVPEASGAQGTVTVPPITTKGAPSVACTFGNAPKAASLNVTNSWVINGTSYANGSQPTGITATLSLTSGGNTTNAEWGVAKSGYTAGSKVQLRQTTSIATTMPGCTVTNQSITSVDGNSTAAALPYGHTLKSDTNTAHITNTVNCKTQLTLTKQVEGGTTPATEWTLTAHLPTGAAAITGTTGVKQDVAAGTALQLAEAGTDPRYVQKDLRTDSERLAAPRSTGSWDCVAMDAAGTPMAGVLGGRAGINGTVTPALGSYTNCTAVNQTAKLSVLTLVENRNGTGTATPAEWQLTATPAEGVGKLLPSTIPGANQLTSASAIQVRPGHGYNLSQTGGAGGYQQVKLQRFTGTDPGNAAALNLAANWEDVKATTPVAVAAGQHQVYRFINRDAVRFQLPLTGGTGALPYLLMGGALMVLGLGAFLKRRNSTSRTP